MRALLTGIMDTTHILFVIIHNFEYFTLIKGKININNSIFHPFVVNNLNFELFFNNLIFIFHLLLAY